jgi:uncharacterized protein YciI
MPLDSSAQKQKVCLYPICTNWRFEGNAEDKWFLLEYTYVDNMLTKRVPHRQAHLEVAKEAIEKGNLILGGAHSDTKLATIVFKAKDASVVKSFAENDPYVKEGLVTSKYS